MNGFSREDWNFALVQAVVTVLAATCEEPPGAAQDTGEHGGAVVRGGLGELRRRQRAGQEVVHDAPPDAYLLHGALDHVEHQGYEPQQHQLIFDLEEGLVHRLPMAFRQPLAEAVEQALEEQGDDDDDGADGRDDPCGRVLQRDLRPAGGAFGSSSSGHGRQQLASSSTRTRSVPEIGRAHV